MSEAPGARVRSIATTVALVGALGAFATGCSTEAGTKVDVKPGATASPSLVAETEAVVAPADTDGDGWSDDTDFRPNDAAVQTRADVDTDKDGTPDGDDVRPKDPKVQTRGDIDTDGDGAADFRDDFPRNARYVNDTDGDRVADVVDAFPKNPRYSQDTDGDGVANGPDAFPNDPSRSRITLAMENALGAARDYLGVQAFSRQGLIEQLSSDFGSGFNLPDATWAVDQLTVNWNEQAVRAAKDYLTLMSFSRQGLIEQLSSSYGSGFTLSEATYAVNKIGL